MAVTRTRRWVVSGLVAASCLAGAPARALPGFRAADRATAAPEIRYVTSAAQRRRLSDWRGRPVLLNFWATWCVPCLVEMPSLDRLQAAPPVPGLVVLCVSAEAGGLTAIEAFYGRLGLGALSVAWDPNALAAAAYGVKSLPETVLIDREGRVRGQVTGAVEWDGAAARALIAAHLP